MLSQYHGQGISKAVNVCRLVQLCLFVCLSNLKAVGRAATEGNKTGRDEDVVSLFSVPDSVPGILGPGRRALVQAFYEVLRSTPAFLDVT
jgi:hypothetical protein